MLCVPGAEGEGLCLGDPEGFQGKAMAEISCVFN